MSAIIEPDLTAEAAEPTAAQYAEKLAARDDLIAELRNELDQARVQLDRAQGRLEREQEHSAGHDADIELLNESLRVARKLLRQRAVDAWIMRNVRNQFADRESEMRRLLDQLSDTSLPEHAASVVQQMREVLPEDLPF